MSPGKKMDETTDDDPSYKLSTVHQWAGILAEIKKGSIHGKKGTFNNILITRSDLF